MKFDKLCKIMAITLCISVSSSVTLDSLDTYLPPQAVFSWIVHICLSWKLKQIDFDCMQGKTFSLRGQSSTGTGCLADCVVPDCVDSWGFSKPDWKKVWATWSELIVDPAFSRRLDYGPSDEVLSSLNKPVILMFCLCSWRRRFLAMCTFHEKN